MSKVRPLSWSCSRSPHQSPVNFGREIHGPPNGGGCEAGLLEDAPASPSAGLSPAVGSPTLSDAWNPLKGEPPELVAGWDSETLPGLLGCEPRRLEGGLDAWAKTRLTQV